MYGHITKVYASTSARQLAEIPPNYPCQRFIDTKSACIRYTVDRSKYSDYSSFNRAVGLCRTWMKHAIVQPMQPPLLLSGNPPLTHSNIISVSYRKDCKRAFLQMNQASHYIHPNRGPRNNIIRSGRGKKACIDLPSLYVMPCLLKCKPPRATDVSRSYVKITFQ